jgi:hypothetical protein
MKLKPFHPLSQGLEMSLLLNEAGGNILYDATGNQNHGIGTNIAWGADGLDLAGDNENITVPNFIDQDADWTVFTSFVQDVRNPNAQAADTMLFGMKTGTGSVGRAILFINDKVTPTYKLRTYIDGVNRTANTVINVGEAYTAGLTQEGTSFHFYLNGKDDGSFVATANAANGDIILFDHRNNPGIGCLDGQVKVVHWYSRPLSAAEMMWLDYDSFGMFEPDHIVRGYHKIGIFDVALTLDMSNTLAESAQANAGAALALNQIASVADGGHANADASATLADILGISESALATALSATTLSQIVTIANAGKATAEATLELAKGVTITTGAVAVSEASLSLANILAVTQIPGQAVEVDTTLASTYSTTEAAIAAAQAALTLTHDQTTTPSATAAAGASLSLAQILAIAQITGQDIDVDLTLAQVMGVADAAQVVAQASALFPKIVTASPYAAATAAAAMSLAYHAVLTTISGGATEAVIAFAMQQGVNATVTIERGASMGLLQSLEVAESGQATAEGGMALNHNLAVVLLAQAMVSAGLSLDAIQAITTTATATTLTIITPGGRTIIIGLEDRTIAIGLEDRTISISSAN